MILSIVTLKVCPKRVCSKSRITFFRSNIASCNSTEGSSSVGRTQETIYKSKFEEGNNANRGIGRERKQDQTKGKR